MTSFQEARVLLPWQTEAFSVQNCCQSILAGHRAFLITWNGSVHALPSAFLNLISFNIKNCLKKVDTLFAVTWSRCSKAPAKTRNVFTVIGPWYENFVGAIHRKENLGKFKSFSLTRRPLAHRSLLARRLSGTILPLDLKSICKTET